MSFPVKSVLVQAERLCADWTRRSTSFLNGLPLVVIELNKPGVPARAAFDENLTHYKQQMLALFWFNALIGWNGTDSRVGSLTEWNRIGARTSRAGCRWK
jgi:hypothetical protein